MKTSIVSKVRAKARLREVQYVAGELRIFQKCAIIQKSEIFTQSALKLGQNDRL